jgi:hypothetical protein
MKPTPLPTLPQGYAIQYSRTPWRKRVAAFIEELLLRFCGF